MTSTTETKKNTFFQSDFFFLQKPREKKTVKLRPTFLYFWSIDTFRCGYQKIKKPTPFGWGGHSVFFCSGAAEPRRRKSTQIRPFKISKKQLFFTLINEYPQYIEK